MYMNVMNAILMHVLGVCDILVNRYLANHRLAVVHLAVLSHDSGTPCGRCIIVVAPH